MKNEKLLAKGLFLFFVAMLLMTSCKEQEVKQAPPTQVSVVSVIQKDVPVFKEYVGQTYGVFDIPIRARVQGFLEGIHFDEGTKVHKGDRLYSIDPQSYKAQVAASLSDIAQAKTLLVKAENDLNRYRPLAEANAVSQSDLDNAVASYEAAKAEVAAAEANYDIAEIELGYTVIYSPIDGIIGKTKAKVGEFVGQNPNPVILNTVSDVSSINVEFFLNEAEYLTFAKEFIQNKKTAPRQETRKDNIELILADGSVFSEKGYIVFIDREVNAFTGSILVQARFSNPNSLLRPGQYAKVKVQITTLENALLVPQACVMELQGQHSLFIVNSNNEVKRIQVTTGIKIDDFWVIKEGLKPTDQVVLDGIQKVRNGAVVEAKKVDYQSKTTKQ